MFGHETHIGAMLNAVAYGCGLKTGHVGFLVTVKDQGRAVGHQNTRGGVIIDVGQTRCLELARQFLIAR